MRADGGVFEIPAYHTEVINFATAECLTPSWVQIFCRAIGANWLVCFAVYVSISTRKVAPKNLATWSPTFTFVAFGLDLVMANMYLFQWRSFMVTRTLALAFTSGSR